MRYLLLAALCLMPVVAGAQSRPDTLRNTAGPSILIWKSYEALKEGNRLIAAEVFRTQPQLIVRLIACKVPNETKVVVTDGGFTASDILVVDGPSAGCRGTIENEYFAK